MPEESTGRHARHDDADDVVDAEVLPMSANTTAGPIVTPPDSGYTASGVPTFDSVREKIENRYGASLGSAELDAETPEGRSIEEQYEARQKAATERLEQIRASMHPDQVQGEAGNA
jgi:phage shock protein A